MLANAEVDALNEGGIDRAIQFSERDCKSGPKRMKGFWST
jgi:hypothetical protein